MIWRLPSPIILKVQAKPSSSRKERDGRSSLAHDVLIGLGVLNLHGQGRERVPLVIGQAESALQHADERMGVGIGSCSSYGFRVRESGWLPGGRRYG